MIAMVNDRLFSGYSYLKHLIFGGNAHGLHSPFVYNMYTNIIVDHKVYYDFNTIEKLRSKLLKNNSLIITHDLGAGSQKMSSNKRRISSIAKYALSERKISQLLFKMIDYYKPQYVIELGTSLGINSIYLSRASKMAEVHTFEGCPEIGKVAQENFSQFDVNIHQHIGNIFETLPPVLNKLKRVDFVYFDAFHKKEPTIKFFEMILPYTHEETILVFGDIYWSKEMSEAWELIKEHPSIHLTVDLYYVGMAFFRKKQAKQHFRLKL